MKVDVAVSFFRQRELWPLVARGLEANAESINKVIIVNDEPWPIDWRPELHGIPFDYYAFDRSHPGDFGAARTNNKGADLVTTPWFVHIDDDVMLQPGMVAALIGALDKGALLVFAPHLYVPTQHIARVYEAMPPVPAWFPSFCSPDKPQEWGRVTSGCCYAVRKSAFELVRWNEEMPDPGFQDTEFCARFMVKWGQASVATIPSHCLVVPSATLKKAREANCKAMRTAADAADAQICPPGRPLA